MSGLGLTSQEAQKRLFEELTVLISRRIKISWPEEAKKNLSGILSSVLIGAAGLLLVVQFAVSPDGRSVGMVLFQAIFLLLVAPFNLSILGWEMYMLRTQKVRQLLGRLSPMLESPHPWTSSDYPKSSISTLRGLLTIPAFRDGILVNVPISLLVYGDVMELDPGIPSPANAVRLRNDSGNIFKNIEVGEVLPEHVFKSRDVGEKGGSFSFLAEVNPVQLEVKETPILAYLESTLQKEDPPSFVSREVNLLICIATIVFALVYLTTLFLNLLRYFVLKEDFDNSWPEMFFGLPVYTSLPLLLLHFPLVWSLTNLYGTARIILLVEEGPLCFHYFDWKRKIMTFFRTLRVMGKLLFWHTHYSAYRMFHILGTLTSVCAVDKEYLLSSGFPSPEKIFLLRTEDVLEKPMQQSSPMGQDCLSENNDGAGAEAEPVGVSINVIEPSDGEIISPKESMSYHYQISQKTGVKFHVGLETMEEDEEECEQEKLNMLQVHSQMDSLSSASVVSDPAPFELVIEILDISPDPNSYSGIAFDDVHWQTNIGSLKPIGVNLLATSHLTRAPFYFSPLDSYREFKLHLHKSSCSCSLGMEIGVTEYFSGKFQKQLMICSVSSPGMDFHKTIHRKSTATFMANNNSNMLPHITSIVVSEFETGKSLVMSRGSGNMIASCCSDFWDGRDLHPMTDTERISIVNYYDSRSISSYCIALAYNPMLDLSVSDFPQKEIGIFIPPSDLENNHSNLSLISCKETSGQLLTAEQLFKNLQCNQVFLGLVTLQYRPKQDVVSLIEDLYAAGIRFVHFTAENEHRAKIFAQKLGLEADWNCFISLAQPTSEEGIDGNEPPNKSPNEESSNDDDDDDSQSSMASSMLSIINAAMSNIHARLPKGIDNIRPHIEKVDNVPLLVSLFTDCNTETITSMIEIMQENSEVVLCIGNAWNHQNMTIFSQADIGLSLIPKHVDFPTCAVTQTCAASISNSLQNSSCIAGNTKSYPNPLEVASYVNSTSCQLCFGRDKDVSLLSLIWESRRLLSLVHLSLIFSVGASFSLSVLMLLSSLFFLPPPLRGRHIFWLITAVIPIIMLSFLATPLDPKFKTLMPIKMKKPFPNLWLVVLEFGLFGITGIYTLILFSFTLGEICIMDITNSSCHVLLGDRNPNNTSPWNSWRGSNEQGLLFAQDSVAFFMTIYLVVLSTRYIHRTRPLWQLWRFVSWQYLVVTSGAVIIQVICFAVSISDHPSTPVSLWCLGLLWPFAAIGMTEFLKYVDKRKFKKAQTLLELQFGTKLGMHSPVS